MKKVIKTILTISCTFALVMATMMSVNAAEGSLRRGSTAKSSVGTASVYCTGTYRSYGVNRWNRFWEAYSGGSLKEARVASSTISIPDDKYMSSTATVSMTTFNYQSGSGTCKLAFRFNGSSVVADN